MGRRVNTTCVRQKRDVAVFFDRLARNYEETHGHSDRLLRHRLNLIRELACLREDALILEIGCGKAGHLLSLVGGRRQGIGIDISSAMIREASETAGLSGSRGPVSFRVDEGEYLATIADSSIDLAFCVGSFEHFLDQKAALSSAYRVLKRQARFVCLTPNGASVYYRWVSPFLRLPARHLSTDAFVTAAQAGKLLTQAGFEGQKFGYWSFIPKGDMPAAVGSVLQVLDVIGRLVLAPFFRGGLYFVGIKP